MVRLCFNPSMQAVSTTVVVKNANGETFELPRPAGGKGELDFVHINESWTKRITVVVLSDTHNQVSVNADKRQSDLISNASI